MEQFKEGFDVTTPVFLRLKDAVESQAEVHYPHFLIGSELHGRLVIRFGQSCAPSLEAKSSSQSSAGSPPLLNIATSTLLRGSRLGNASFHVNHRAYDLPAKAAPDPVCSDSVNSTSSVKDT